jgi:hypothetical protein
MATAQVQVGQLPTIAIRTTPPDFAVESRCADLVSNVSGGCGQEI